MFLFLLISTKSKLHCANKSEEPEYRKANGLTRSGRVEGENAVAPSLVPAVGLSGGAPGSHMVFLGTAP